MIGGRKPYPKYKESRLPWLGRVRGRDVRSPRGAYLSHDARNKKDTKKVGYEISPTRHFYKPQPLRTLEEIRTDILALENEAQGLLTEILGQGAKE